MSEAEIFSRAKQEVVKVATAGLEEIAKCGQEIARLKVLLDESQLETSLANEEIRRLFPLKAALAEAEGKMTASIETEIRALESSRFWREKAKKAEAELKAHWASQEGA